MSGPPFCARRWTRAAAFRRRTNFPCNIFSARRIGTEPLSCWRRTLADSFPEARKREFREAPDALWRWIRESIRQVPQTEYRQLVTLPAGAMRLRCADLPSQRLLFVAICRTLGIPARLNPAGGAAEYALDGQFFSPEAGRTANARLQLQKQPGETWQPGGGFRPLGV